MRRIQLEEWNRSQECIKEQECASPCRHPLSSPLLSPCLMNDPLGCSSSRSSRSTDTDSGGDRAVCPCIAIRTMCWMDSLIINVPFRLALGSPDPPYLIRRPAFAGAHWEQKRGGLKNNSIIWHLLRKLLLLFGLSFQTNKKERQLKYIYLFCGQRFSEIMFNNS